MKNVLRVDYGIVSIHLLNKFSKIPDKNLPVEEIKALKNVIKNKDFLNKKVKKVKKGIDEGKRMVLIIV